MLIFSNLNSWRTCNSGDVLDRQLKATQHGIYPGLRSTELNIVYPVTGCLLTRIFLLGSAAVFSYLMVFAVRMIIGFGSYGQFQFSAYQIQIDPARSLDLSTTDMDLQSASFSLLLNGCTVAAANLTAVKSAVAATEGLLFTTALNSVVTANGFTVSLNGDVGMGRVAIQGSADGGRTWSVVGLSSFRQVPEGIRQLDAPLAGGPRTVRLDYSLRWPLVAESAVTNLLLAAGLLAATLCALAGRPPYARWVLAISCGLVALNHLVAAVGFATLGLPRDLFSPIVHTLLFALVGAAFLGPEAVFPRALAAAGAASLVTRVLQDTAVYSDAGYLAASPPYPQIAALLLGLAFLAHRRRFLAAAAAAAAEQAARAEERWRPMANDPANAARLGELAALCDEVQAGLDGGASPVICQFYRSTSGPQANDCDASQSEHSGSAEPGPPAATDSDPTLEVTSLDQLYSQALGLDPLLRALCRRWTARCGGVLDAADQRGDAAAAPHAYGAAVASECFRYLKDPARAVAKVATCYGGDVSRLTDVCRARVLFDRVEDLVALLQAVRGEECVHIVRLRNWMRPESYAGSGNWYRVRRRAWESSQSLLL